MSYELKELSSKVLVDRFNKVRRHCEQICKNLNSEQYNLQTKLETSPAKWQLAHVSWFYEEFILKRLDHYQVFNDRYSYLFNSYYETIGERQDRDKRSLISKPNIEEAYRYRRYIDNAIIENIDWIVQNQNILSLFEMGLQHEQQHTELLLTDLKYNLYISNDPDPLFHAPKPYIVTTNKSHEYIKLDEGLYEIGASHQDDFSFDNERPQHRVFIEAFSIRNNLVTNAEYIEFIESGGYSDFRYWLSEGFDWIKKHNIQMPLYWRKNSKVRRQSKVVRA